MTSVKTCEGLSRSFGLYRIRPRITSSERAARAITFLYDGPCLTLLNCWSVYFEGRPCRQAWMSSTRHEQNRACSNSTVFKCFSITLILSRHKMNLFSMGRKAHRSDFTLLNISGRLRWQDESVESPLLNIPGRRRSAFSYILNRSKGLIQWSQTKSHTLEDPLLFIP